MLQILSQTFITLWTHKLRSFLTMFGIAWGVLSLVLLTGSGEGFRVAQRTASQGLGKDILVLWGGRTSVQARGYQAGRRISLRFSDFELIRDKARQIALVSPEIMRQDLMSVSDWNNGNFNICGIYPQFQYMRSIDVDGGRLIREPDNEESRTVCILGWEAAEQLFPRGDPVGKEMRIGGFSFKVIGVVRKKTWNGSYGGLDQRKVFIPFHTMVKIFSKPALGESPDWLDDIIAMPKDPERFKEAEQNIREILGAARNFDPLDQDALTIWNTAMGARMVQRIIRNMTNFLGLVGLVTLVLGGIGVMNIMLVSVRERTVEIGIRKSVGATRGSIRMQFFAESVVLAMTSGLIGLGTAYGVASLVNKLEAPPQVFAGLIISDQMAIIAFSSIVLVAILSGFVPASLAADMEPIAALRYEAS